MKKIIAAILALTMLASAFASCDSAEKQTEAGESNSVDLLAVVKDFEEYLMQPFVKECKRAGEKVYPKPYGGMTELMERLSERCLVAINSNKQDSFVKVLASRLFGGVPLIAAEGYRPDRPFKPDPTMAHAIMAIAAEKLGETLTPDQCIYVGDSDVDYYTAKNAGMQAVSVSWGYRSHEFLKSLGDQPVAATVDELWEILSGLQA